MEQRCLLYPSMFAHYADYLEAINVQNSGYVHFAKAMKKENWENTNYCDVFVADAFENGTLNLQSYGIPRNGHRPIPPWDILVDLDRHLLTQPKDLSTRLIIVQLLAPNQPRFFPFHVIDLLGVTYNLDAILLWSIYESMKYKATSVEVDRLSFRTDYLALHVELQGGSPVRAWVTTTKKVVLEHSVNIVIMFLNHRCPDLDREMYPIINPLKEPIKKMLRESKYAWDSQTMLRRTFETYQQYSGTMGDGAALDSLDSAAVRFMFYFWKLLEPETIKLFNNEPLEFVTPLLTLFRQAFAADLQNLRTQYRPIAAQTHATESHEKMLLELWVQARRDIEMFSTTTRAIEAYISKNITNKNCCSKPSVIRDAVNGYIRILSQAREDEAYMKDRLSVNVGTLSLIESRNSIVQSRSTGRVTFLAFVFLPLSLVTSFFGMNIQQLTGNGSSITSFFVAAVCTTLFTILIWALMNFAFRLMEAWKEYDREIKESRYELDYNTSARIRKTWKKVFPEKRYW